MESALFLASLYLGAAVLIVPLAVRLGLGSVLGYLGAGILLGPVLGLAGAETRDLQHVAEFGVVMMLFLIGLELQPRTVWDMRAKLLGLGGSQVLLTMTAIAAAMAGLGYAWQVALTLGMILSLSSTAIVIQTLDERNLMRTPGGRASFATLLFQDVAMVLMLALIPILTLAATDGPLLSLFGVNNPPAADVHTVEGAAEPLISLVQALPGWAATLLTLSVVAGIILAGNFLTRPVFRFVHASRLPEMSTFISLLVVICIAFLMVLVGLSPALGTFVAGVVLANSEFRHQIEADIAPFKGLLLGLFFMTVGVNVNFRLVADAPFTVLGFTLGLIAVKVTILFIISLFFRLKGRDRWLLALGLAQGSEFGFVLTAFARSEGAIPLAAGQMVQLVISLSMLFTPLLFLLHDRVDRWATRHAPKEAAADEITEKGRVIIAGIGRFGQTVNRLLRTSGVQTVVLDSDIGAIEAVRRFGVKGYFGDPSRPELLAAAGLADAEVLVVAIDDAERVTRIVRYARQQRPDLHIVARARDRVHVFELFKAGANDIVRETYDSSIRAGRYALENLGFSDYEAASLSQTFYKVERGALRELAELWVPGQPVHLNEAYVARATQLDRDLQDALLGDLAEGHREAGTEPNPKASAAE
ncbi:MAG: cation:proton antiporter [Tabrizicola sp.]|uniref:cation:proton antiporter domain-containing protein n=1 Tax=Tabrizicola sp. TaxID=2005166 RepID=UPI002733A247|nr:cation:proton antiporter [Tabrizicola sp.]MDP3261355.1 cation:proton antiporter [Tabrizicola sp.]MDP3649144.1 cation:proton antiporter [Paracoccaceae bacterium]MDZ4069985.1 cation:proton antiporter [Tabrizicola sp.]